jgi:hypothetical protein
MYHLPPALNTFPEINIDGGDFGGKFATSVKHMTFTTGVTTLVVYLELIMSVFENFRQKI